MKYAVAAFSILSVSGTAMAGGYGYGGGGDSYGSGGGYAAPAGDSYGSGSYGSRGGYAAPAPAPVHVPQPVMHQPAPAYATGVAGAAGPGATHTVIVGGSGLVYNPPHVMAAVGDVVHFVFLSKNHTITQSTFDEPCKKKPDGIDSGFLPNEANSTASAPTFQYTVKETGPTWWYCKQKTPANHCTGGMVFAVNPTAEKTFDTFLAKAKSGAGGAAAAPPAGGAPKPGITLSVDNQGVAIPAPTGHAMGGPSGVVPGFDQAGGSGACACACFCGTAAFPPGDGIGAYGGMPGAMPAPW